MDEPVSKVWFEKWLGKVCYKWIYKRWFIDDFWNMWDLWLSYADDMFHKSSS